MPSIYNIYNNLAFACELGVNGRQCGGKWLRNQTVRGERPDIMFN